MGQRRCNHQARRPGLAGMAMRREDGGDRPGGTNLCRIPIAETFPITGIVAITFTIHAQDKKFCAFTAGSCNAFHLESPSSAAAGHPSLQASVEMWSDGLPV